MSGRSITGWPIGCARTSSSACWPITWNGTCVSASRRCCSTTLTKHAAEALRASVVAQAQRSPAAVRKQTTGVTPDGLPVHSFRSLLADLATLARNTIVTAITPEPSRSSC